MGMLKHFRWSLRTQVLVVLLVGLLGVIWQRREPWGYDRDVLKVEPVGSKPLSWVSPDRTRAVVPTGRWVKILYCDSVGVVDHKNALWKTSLNFDRVPDAAFLDNETFFVKPLDPIDERSSQFSIFRRRFPEWWWGHFYRPEVWLFPLLLGAVIWSIRKDRAVKA